MAYIYDTNYVVQHRTDVVDVVDDVDVVDFVDVVDDIDVVDVVDVVDFVDVVDDVDGLEQTSTRMCSGRRLTCYGHGVILGEQQY